MPIRQIITNKESELGLRRDSWSRYWSSGTLHSCPGSFAGNYDGSIRAYWHAAFACLQPGHRVLDVATGNGALPQLLLGHAGANTRDCVIDAIDLAEIAPTWIRALEVARRSRLRLHAGVRAEALPFDDGSFHLVISQYGLEYADRSQAMTEVVRVLCPGGRICLLMHHADSVPVRRGRAELPLLEALCGPQGLLSLASRLLPWVVLAATPAGRVQLQENEQASADRLSFNEGQAKIDQLASAAPDHADVAHEARHQIQQILAASQINGAASGAEALAQLQAAYDEHLLRTRELIDCALDETAMADVLSLLDRLGLAQARAVPLHYGAHLMGWALQAERA